MESFSAPEQIKTGSLLLRNPRSADAQAIYENYASDPEVTRYLIWAPHKSIKDTKAFIDRCLSVWNDGIAFPYVIERNTDGHLLGMIDIRISGFQADIGYVLAKEFWGQGFMSEAAKWLVDWALEQQQIYRVWAICDIENVGSVRVMEKAGMLREGILRSYFVHPNISNEPRDVFMYAKVKEKPR